MSEEPTIHLTRDQLAEIDRAARAYGFEVGRGHPLVDIVDNLSDDNPFLDKNWRSALYQRPDLPYADVVHKNIFDQPPPKDI